MASPRIDASVGAGILDESRSMSYDDLETPKVGHLNSDDRREQACCSTSLNDGCMMHAINLPFIGRDREMSS